MSPAITVHFHPGWGFGARTVIEALASTGVYRTQWETGDATARAAFCWPDSVYEPRMVGGAERLEELCALADAGLLDASLLPGTAANVPIDDPLNDYVEAHVHGGLVLAHRAARPPGREVAVALPGAVRAAGRRQLGSQGEAAGEAELVGRVVDPAGWTPR